MLPWFGCLASALKYLHSLGIKHNDLKPLNTLVDDESIWIIDFGTAIDTVMLGTAICRGTAKARSIRYSAHEGGYLLSLDRQPN
jgi:serine/threonine protein kinase